MTLTVNKGSTWNPPDQDYTTTLANGVSRTLQSRLEDIPSVKDFGVVGDGITDDTTNFQNAINAANVLIVPPGTYLLSAQLTNIGKPLTLIGAGVKTTSLRWGAGSASAGIKVTQNDDDEFVYIDDLTLETAQTAVGTAIEVDGTGQISGGVVQNRFNPRVVISKVYMRGVISPNTDGWDAGINLINTQETRIADCVFVGNFLTTNDNIQSGNGVAYSGTGAPTQHMISRFTCYFASNAISVTGNAEGVFVDQSNLVANTRGIFWNTPAVELQLSVNNSHITAYQACIQATNLYQSSITNTLFFARNDAVANVVGIQFDDDCQFNTISGNTFVNTSVSFDFNAIAFLASATIKNNNIVGNIFQNGTSAIILNASVNNNVISLNNISTSWTNRIVDNSGVATNLILDHNPGIGPEIVSLLKGLRLNSLATGDRDTFLTLHSDDTNTGFSARLIRSLGVNGNLILTNKGTGNLIFSTNDIQRWQILAGTLPAIQAVTNSVRITTGTGSPEGVVSAVVGSLYMRDDGGGGTSLYVKEGGGAGNTGWVAK